MAEDVTRVEIGFDGGLIVITKIAPKEWTALESALAGGVGCRPVQPATTRRPTTSTSPRSATSSTRRTSDGWASERSTTRRGGIPGSTGWWARTRAPATTACLWVAIGVVCGRPVRVAATVWGTLAVNYAVKSGVRRERPAELRATLVPAPASPSFPSSHAAMSTAAAIVLCAVRPRLAPVWVGMAAAMAGAGCTPACTIPATSPPGSRWGPSPAPSARPSDGRGRGRPGRPAELRQVDPVQRAHRRRRRRGAAHVLDDRDGDRRRRRARSPARGARPHLGRRARSCRRRCRWSTSPGSSAARRTARAWAISSWAASAPPMRSCTWCAVSTTTPSPIPSGRVDPLDDAETVELELAFADLAAIERRAERVAQGRQARRAGRGRRAGGARRAARVARGGPAGAHVAGRDPGRRSTC